MPRTIWKFPLALTDHQEVRMPIGSLPRFVAVQHEELCLWAEVNPEAPTAPRPVFVVGTGHPIHPQAGYVGSAIMSGGNFVWHVYV